MRLDFKNIPPVAIPDRSNCTDVAIEQGIAVGTPISKIYIAMGHLYFDKLDDFISSFAPHANTIMGDIPNFTDTMPIFQISEVIV